MQALQHSRLFWELSQVNPTFYTCISAGSFTRQCSVWFSTYILSQCSSLGLIPFGSQLALKKNKNVTNTLFSLLAKRLEYFYH